MRVHNESSDVEGIFMNQSTLDLLSSRQYFLRFSKQIPLDLSWYIYFYFYYLSSDETIASRRNIFHIIFQTTARYIYLNKLGLLLHSLVSLKLLNNKEIRGSSPRRCHLSWGSYRPCQVGPEFCLGYYLPPYQISVSSVWVWKPSFTFEEIEF